MSAPTRIRGILFDLDGTLADTAPDLAYALNATLQAFGKPPLPFERIRPAVSHGGTALIRVGFALGPDDIGYEERRQHLLEVYLKNICHHTRLFAGMEHVIACLEAHHLPWGVVTNKPSWLTEPLLQALALEARAGAVVSGDTCERSKPHPEPILRACRLLGLAPGACVYVGDAARDIEAGRRAGTHTLAAAFGYLRPEDEPDSWGADALLENPRQLLDWIGIAEACGDELPAAGI